MEAAAAVSNDSSTLRLLEDVLRGVSRLVGCNSTNLIVFDPSSDTVQVMVGVTDVDMPAVASMERMLGVSLRGISASVDRARDGLLYQVWKDGRIRETCSISEMVGSALDRNVVERFEKMVGQHRFALVAARGQQKNFGVLVFEKSGTNPFSLQQRLVLGRYARRIGDILEASLETLDPESILKDELDPVEAALVRLSVQRPVPALFLDADMRITGANDALQSRFGWEKHRIVGSGIDAFFSDAGALARLLNQQAIYEHKWLDKTEVVVRCADGTLSPAEAEALLLADEQKRVAGYLLLLRRPTDYTDGTSEHLMGLAELAAHLAHEIRNPLVASAAALRSLQGKLENPAHEEIISSVVCEMARLDQVLKKFLFSRPVLYRQEVDLRELVEEVADLLRPRAQERKTLVENIVGPGTEVTVDQDSFKQVFFNLLSNSIEACRTGGRVAVSARRNNSELLIDVEDDGCGPPREPEVCFRPFFTTKPSGTGLGLGVCRTIVRAHGGAIRMMERPGGGCRVRIVLPLKCRNDGAELGG